MTNVRSTLREIILIHECYIVYRIAFMNMMVTIKGKYLLDTTKNPKQNTHAQKYDFFLENKT